MPFFERYTALCNSNGYKPAASGTVELLGVTRATVTQWKTHGYLPNAKTLCIMADVFHVSIDYLLCRTDDPTDYSTKPTPDGEKLIQSTELDTDTQRVLLRRYSRLNEKGRALVDSYMIALLAESGRV